MRQQLPVHIYTFTGHPDISEIYSLLFIVIKVIFFEKFIVRTGRHTNTTITHRSVYRRTGKRIYRFGLLNYILLKTIPNRPNTSIVIKESTICSISLHTFIKRFAYKDPGRGMSCRVGISKLSRIYGRLYPEYSHPSALYKADPVKVSVKSQFQILVEIIIGSEYQIIVSFIIFARILDRICKRYIRKILTTPCLDLLSGRVIDRDHIIFIRTASSTHRSFII